MNYNRSESFALVLSCLSLIVTVCVFGCVSRIANQTQPIPVRSHALTHYCRYQILSQFISERLRHQLPPLNPLMADKPNETVMARTGRNLLENIFITSLALTIELAVIYFFTTVLIFSGLYHQVWAIQTVGLLAIIVGHLRQESQNL